MNKTILIIIGIAALLLIGGVIYMAMNRSTSQPQGKKMNTANSVFETENTDQTTMIKKSFRDLAGFGSNQECTFSDQEAGSSGVVFIGNGKVRGDFESDVNGQKVKSHMIQDNENMYVWTDGEVQGFMMALDTIEKASSDMKDAAIDIDKEADFSCKVWSVNPDLFNVPSDVEFRDYSKMLDNVNDLMNGASGTPGVTLDCSVCDGLSGDAQSSCRTALKCN